MLEASLLMAGWLLGLFSPQIVERISRRYRRPELMRSIAVELDELRFKQLTVRCDIRLSRGTADREFAVWVSKRAKAYEGVLADMPARKGLIDYETKTEDELKKENLFKDPPEMVLALTKHHVPFLNSQLNAIGILSNEVQRHLFDILSRIEYYNSTVDKLHTNHMLTFSPDLPQSTRQTIQRNNKRWVDNIDKLAEQIVHKVDAVIEHLGGL